MVLLTFAVSFSDVVGSDTILMHKRSKLLLLKRVSILVIGGRNHLSIGCRTTYDAKPSRALMAHENFGPRSRR
ncbi:hypothetical protein MXEN_19900 [Mycobacterium xenopi RIVM700367]|nr:hypothetical protein MXEN_19900 [Mycobacterium xenopi RIVM700367]ORX22164.1 hypothetical protein AWC32_19755 [Mycobacterium xenopi]